MTQPLEGAYASWRAEGERLAGRLTDLPLRATVYHHVYQDSGGNHVFPLIAAHGALWAGGYFSRALRLGTWLSYQYALSPVKRQQQLVALKEFADVFRDVNRRVCIEVYTNYQFTKAYGDDAGASELVSAELLEALRLVHAARRTGRSLTDAQREAVFTAHFLHEQASVVGPALTDAVRRFEWPLVKYLALRPRVCFAYFPPGRALWFRDFSCREERVKRGLEAFQLAADAGWDRAAESLKVYNILPASFFISSRQHFQTTRTDVLGSTFQLS